MDDQNTCSGDADSGCLEPTFKISGHSFAELQAAYRAVEAVELRRIYHEEQNRLFDKMSKKRQRLTIAKDVLDQLAAGKIKAKRLVFVDRYFNSSCEADREKQLSEVLEKQSSCSVCALGGLFVCAVKRLDKLTVNDLSNASYHSDAVVQGHDIKKYLSRCFDDGQLNLIEIAFEGGRGGYSVDRNNPVAVRAKRYCQGESNSTKRMAKIMRNIIRNDGKFVP